jgi:hypothetical protein
MSDSDSSDDGWRSQKRKPSAQAGGGGGLDLAALKREANQVKKMKLMLSQRTELAEQEEKEEEDEKKLEEKAIEASESKEEEDRRKLDGVSEIEDDMFFQAVPLFVNAASLPVEVHGLDQSEELNYWCALLTSEDFDDTITEELEGMLAKYKGLEPPELLLQLLVHLICTHHDTQIQLQAFRVYETLLLHLPTLSVGERLLDYSPPKVDISTTTRWVPSADDFVSMLVGQGAAPDQDLTPQTPPLATTTNPASTAPHASDDHTTIPMPPICNITKTFHLISLALDTRPQFYKLHDRRRLLLLCLRASLDPHTQSQPAVGSAIASILRASAPEESPHFVKTLLAASSDARSRQRLLSLLPLEPAEFAATAIRRRGSFFLLQEVFASTALGSDAVPSTGLDPDVESLDPSIRDVVRLLDCAAFRTRPITPHIAWFHEVVSLSEMVVSALVPGALGGADPDMKRLLQLWQNTKSRVKSLSEWTIKFRDLLDLCLFRHARLSGDSKLIRM